MTEDKRNPISCDQVAWLLDIANRHIPPQTTPRVCQQREMQKYAMLYEIMDIAGLRFADDAARENGTPRQAKQQQPDSLGGISNTKEAPHVQSN